jgi:hypothetical protein
MLAKADMLDGVASTVFSIVTMAIAIAILYP